MNTEPSLINASIIIATDLTAKSAATAYTLIRKGC